MKRVEVVACIARAGMFGFSGEEGEREQREQDTPHTWGYIIMIYSEGETYLRLS